MLFLFSFKPGMKGIMLSNAKRQQCIEMKSDDDLPLQRLLKPGLMSQRELQRIC
jgi:hypothetical protein